MKWTSVAFTLLVSTMAGLPTGCKTTSDSSSGDFLSSYQGYTQSSSLDDRRVFRGNVDSLDGYQKIFLEEIKIEPPADAYKLKITGEDLSKLESDFRSALAAEIAAGRYGLASGAGPGILSVRASIRDIHPGDPALFLASEAPYVGAAATAATVVTGARIGRGSAKIEAELVDSVSRERIAGVIDEKVGSKLEIVEGMTRWGHIEHAVKMWAKRFGEFLEDPNA